MLLRINNLLNLKNLQKKGDSDAKKFGLNFLVDGQIVGFLMPNVADALKSYSETFVIEEKK